MKSDLKDPPSSISPTLIYVIGGVALWAALTRRYYLIVVLTISIAKGLPYCYRENDTGEARRKAWGEKVQKEGTPSWLRVPHGIEVTSQYFENSRGMLLYSFTMKPTDPAKIKGCVVYCHGYSDMASYLKKASLYRLVKAGFVVSAVEYEGHGRSDGNLVEINSWDTLINDVIDYSRAVIETLPSNCKVFLAGESMGGAVCFDCYSRGAGLFSGIIMVAPMLCIADEMKPPEFVINFIRNLLEYVPSLGQFPLAPSGDLRELSHAVREKLLISEDTPSNFARKPRLCTAREMILVTERIEKEMYDFDGPFLVLHGGADKVTKPSMSQRVYKEAKSVDKTIKIYPGMWHTLLSGEPDENIEKVFGDIVDWLNERV